MNFWQAAWTIFLKDLQVERRTREIVSATSLFAILVVVLCAFAFDPQRMPAQMAGSGSLWVSLCFAGMLAIGRSYLRERDNGVWTGLVLSPASRSGFYLGKLMGLFVFLMAVSVPLVLLVELFFHIHMLANLPGVLLTLALGIFGFCAVGALFGAMIVRTSVRDLILGVVLFPLVSPVLILCAKATELAATGAPVSKVFGYLNLVLGFDVISLVIGIWLFDQLMDD